MVMNAICDHNLDTIHGAAETVMSTKLKAKNKNKLTFGITGLLTSHILLKSWLQPPHMHQMQVLTKFENAPHISTVPHTTIAVAGRDRPQRTPPHPAV